MYSTVSKAIDSYRLLPRYASRVDATIDPYDYSTETLLRRKAREAVELRELLTPVAQELERLACKPRTWPSASSVWWQ